jgi:hypothetical protein
MHGCFALGGHFCGRKPEHPEKTLSEWATNHIGNSFLGKRIYSHFDVRMNDELKLMKKENQAYGHNTKYFAGGR